MGLAIQIKKRENRVRSPHFYVGWSLMAPRWLNNWKKSFNVERLFVAVSPWNCRFSSVSQTNVGFSEQGNSWPKEIFGTRLCVSGRKVGCCLFNSCHKPIVSFTFWQRDSQIFVQVTFATADAATAITLSLSACFNPNAEENFISQFEFKPVLFFIRYWYDTDTIRYGFSDFFWLF